MAPTTTTEMERRQLQDAIAKSVELRALHAALLQNGPGGSPATTACVRLNSASSPTLTRLSTEDRYPVFTPTHEDGMRGYENLRSNGRDLSDHWAGGTIEEEPPQFDMDLFMRNIQIRKAHHVKRDTMSLPDDYLNATTNSCPARRNGNKSDKSYNCEIVELAPADTHILTQLPRKSSKPAFRWRFPRLKKTQKKKNDPQTPRHALNGDAALKGISAGTNSFELECLRKELLEANASREAAVAEATEMRSALHELKQKLAHLETYCRELKNALNQAVQLRANEPPSATAGLKRQGSTSSKRTSKSIESSRHRVTVMPVSAEVMEEGFLQVVSEARLSVKQFCRALIAQTTDVDSSAGVGDMVVEKLDTLLTEHGLQALSAVDDPRRSRTAAYHLESLVNQSLYQDFENCAFHPNGWPVDLDPLRNRRSSFSAFVSLRNLSWNEALKKGGKLYCERFAGFCHRKMDCLAELLGWSPPWPEQILETFCVAAKCVWLAHLLAFSFGPPAVILRVGKGRDFDPVYMEEILLKCRRPPEGPARVEVMVVPGFYVLDRVVKCRVFSAPLHG